MIMIKKLLLLTGLSIALSGFLMADANMKMGEGAKKLAQMAGEKSPYYRSAKEAFPKDYFMVNQNLPFLVGVSLFHPKSDQLKLSKEQLDKLVKMKNSTVPAAAKVAKQIKGMENELAKMMIEEHKEPKSQYELVDKISKLRTDLTKAHLQCIYDIQQVLSPEQFKTLISLATQKVEHVKTDNSKGKELFTQKCATCHTLGRPTDMSKVVAPALNGVMRHLKMSYGEKDKAVAFIKDYVVNPSESKAICMPQKIKRFGLMPSQKGLVSEEELELISTWMFDNYPEKGFQGMGSGRR
jgi:mono/diheme cytochrome c family protein